MIYISAPSVCVCVCVCRNTSKHRSRGAERIRNLYSKERLSEWAETQTQSRPHQQGTNQPGIRKSIPFSTHTHTHTQRESEKSERSSNLLEGGIHRRWLHPSSLVESILCCVCVSAWKGLRRREGEGSGCSKFLSIPSLFIFLPLLLSFSYFRIDIIRCRERLVARKKREETRKLQNSCSLSCVYDAKGSVYRSSRLVCVCVCEWKIKWKKEKNKKTLGGELPVACLALFYSFPAYFFPILFSMIDITQCQRESLFFFPDPSQCVVRLNELLLVNSKRIDSSSFGELLATVLLLFLGLVFFFFHSPLFVYV